jgi:hypothetical protein
VFAAAANADDLSHATNMAVSKSRAAVSNAIGDDMPDWAKRIEWEIRFNEDVDPTGSILTVQPLYQDDTLTDYFYTGIGHIAPMNLT